MTLRAAKLCDFIDLYLWEQMVFHGQKLGWMEELLCFESEIIAAVKLQMVKFSVYNHLAVCTIINVLFYSFSESGSSLLCNPSTALQKLVPRMDTSAIVKSEETVTSDHTEGLVLLQRPVMQFLLQQHDLEALQLAMKQALRFLRCYTFNFSSTIYFSRKAMCRVYAMQALNWLLKSVTQPICLHDLLWWFVTSLTPVEPESETDYDNRASKKIDEQDLNVCEHPISDITIAGDAVHPLPSTFHTLLQTIADLMVLLPMGSALQQMAVRCWGLRFAPTDHSFLHRSQVCVFFHHKKF